VLEPGSPGEWDDGGAARGRVVRSPDGYVMVYRTPARLRGYTYGLAVSADGVHWAKIADNPILLGEDIPRASGLFFPSFIYQDGTYYFYIESFTGSVSQIHLLTRSAPLDIAALSGREDTLSAANLQVSDIANQGNAADLEVGFDSALDGNQIIEYRLILVKADDAAELDLETASNLPEEHYTPIHNEANFIRTRLGEDSLDMVGDAITEEVTYVAYVLSVGETGSSLSNPSKEIVLVNELSVHTLVEKLPSATGGLAVDQEGNLYAANIGRAPSRSGSEIYRISPQGDFELWVSGQGMRGASGNTFDPQGNLYQSSLSANIIHRITPDGSVSVFAQDGIDGPVGIAAASDGSLFVANCRGDSVVRVSPQGEVIPFAEDTLFSCPNGITLDEQGNLYVANFSGGRVLKITAQGEVQDFADVPGGNNGHILYHDGLLYVVSRGGHQIYTLTLEGELSPLAGNGERGHQDGFAGQATFSLPNDIIASLDGHRLYVNEVLPTSGSTNIPSVIRVIELPRQ
jgi:sugar lactone lactonase YvrE